MTEKEIYQKLNELDINVEYVYVLKEIPVITIGIIWGDWKHDHARLDYVMESNFPVKLIRTDVTEEDGSDCYSAIHYYANMEEVENE